MCGICGYLGFDAPEGLLGRMTGIIHHRGPDERGTFQEPEVGLGMARLSIIDLAGGTQPIYNEDGRFVIVFNGEIYNYREVKALLEAKGHRFQTNSDTETIVHLYEEYGADCLAHLQGMFAFAVYDRRERELFLARDRLGIKPLYYWFNQGRLVFGSEIKSILLCDQVPRELDPVSMDRYLSLRYVPGPETLFKGIAKLPAGHFLKFRKGEITQYQYWKPLPAAEEGRPAEYFLERFEELFQESVRMRLMSEVPLGAYLSGGVDSSCVVAAMRRQATGPVKTFSVGFGWEGDELEAARATAEKLECEFHPVVCRPEDIELLPQIVWHSDEPLGDAIAVPTYVLAREASRQVKVVLTGEGADETMAGYLFHRVINLGRVYNVCTPQWLHKGLILPTLGKMPISLLNSFFDYPAYLGSQGKAKVIEYLRTVTDNQPEKSYRHLIALFDPQDKDGLYSRDLCDLLSQGQKANGDGAGEGGFFDRLLLVQYKDWLPDNILLRQDKMSMAHSLEARVPFLDHKLVEFLLTVPNNLKLKGLFGDKHILRCCAKGLLPPENAKRKKKPFYIPVERQVQQKAFWRLVDMTLNPDQVKKRGYFDPDKVRQMVEGVNRNEFIRVKQVLALVILELWHMIYLDRSLDVAPRPAEGTGLDATP